MTEEKMKSAFIELLKRTKQSTPGLSDIECAFAVGFGLFKISVDAGWKGESAILQAATSDTQSQAAQDVLAERQRQVTAEGWTPEHDDRHSSGCLAVAAACYALQTAADAGATEAFWPSQYSDAARALWPFDAEWWKYKSPRNSLVKAGALIIAEIERLDRAASAPKGDGND